MTYSWLAACLSVVYLAACAREQSPLDLPRIPPADRAAELAAAAAVPESSAVTGTSPLAAAPTTAQALAEGATLADLSADVSEGQDFLVWQRVEGKTVTWWIHLQGGDSRVEGHRDGLWLAARGDIYGWKLKRRKVRACELAACAEEDGACVSVLVGGGPFQGRIDDVELVGLGTPRPRPLGPRLADSAALDLGTPGLHRYIAPTAQLGPLLLVEVVTETLSCGPMHGETTREMRLAVVPDGSLLPAADAAIETELLGGIPKESVDVLRHEQPAAVGLLRWLTLHQRREPSGKWTLEQEFGRDEPLTGGRTLLRTLRAPVGELPAAWQDYRRQAPDLSAVADELPPPPKEQGEVHAGWSHIALAKERKEELRRLFLASNKGP